MEIDLKIRIDLNDENKVEKIVDELRHYINVVGVDKNKEKELLKEIIDIGVCKDLKKSYEYVVEYVGSIRQYQPHPTPSSLIPPQQVILNDK